MNKLPTELWFGTTDAQWPIHCWEAERHAIAWVREQDGLRKRRIWKASVSNPVEYTLVTPEPHLEVVDG